MFRELLYELFVGQFIRPAKPRYRFVVMRQEAETCFRGLR